MIDRAKLERRLDRIVKKGEPEGMKAVVIANNNLETLEVHLDDLEV